MAQSNVKKHISFCFLNIHIIKNIKYKNFFNYLKGNGQNKTYINSRGRDYMEKDIKKMIDEFTTNYSDLFVDAFLIKYLNDYEKDNLDIAINEAYTNLVTKLKKKIILKMQEINKDAK